MRISDWSSDVCSSDLIDAVVVGRDAQVDRRVRACEGVEAREQPARREGADDADLERLAEVAVRILVERRGDAVERLGDDGDERTIGSESCRGRRCPYVLISVVAEAFKNNTKTK